MLAMCLAVWTGFSAPVQAPGELRVGRIVIEGNTDTPDRVILEHVPLRPGQRLRYADLIAARDGLRKCGHFRVNPWRDVGPTVEALPNELDNQFRDVRIRIQEKPLNWLRFGARDLILAAVLGDADEMYREAVWLFDAGRRHFFGIK